MGSQLNIRGLVKCIGFSNCFIKLSAILLGHSMPNQQIFGNFHRDLFIDMFWSIILEYMIVFCMVNLQLLAIVIVYS